MNLKENDQIRVAITEEEVSQIIAAILDGKYSLACALLLRFCGYEPSDYIPYRTYIRLMKEVCQKQTSLKLLDKENTIRSPKRASGSQPKTKIKDLNHLEPVRDVETSIVGGYRLLCGHEAALSKQFLMVEEPMLWLF
jgi:hypothetical protein